MKTILINNSQNLKIKLQKINSLNLIYLIAIQTLKSFKNKIIYNLMEIQKKL